ncbi:hypothetical protein T09_4594 [Trichinella sp. T9]|nr:hypothetical protein T09_4594 [Trichinella sp. T9]
MTTYMCFYGMVWLNLLQLYSCIFLHGCAMHFNGGPTAECVKIMSYNWSVELYNGKRSSSKSSFCAKSLFTIFKNAPAVNLLIFFIIKNHLACKKFALGEKLLLRKVGIAQQDAPFVEGRTFEIDEIQEKLDDYNSIMLACKKRYANVSRCCLPLGMKTLSHSNNGEQWRSSRRSHAYRKPLSASRSAWLNN